MKSPLMQMLVVEDNADLVTRMRDVLQPAGIKLTVVGSGEQAMELVRQRRFDLVILNIRLPGINGLDVCRSLKMDPDLKDIPVIFASDETSPHFKAKALRLGAVDYLHKPFEAEDFKARVLAHLPKPDSVCPPAQHRENA